MPSVIMETLECRELCDILTNLSVFQCIKCFKAIQRIKSQPPHSSLLLYGFEEHCVLGVLLLKEKYFYFLKCYFKFLFQKYFKGTYTCFNPVERKATVLMWITKNKT